MDIPTRLNRLCFVICLLSANYAKADCYDYAAAYHQVNPWVLRAIVDVESNGNPSAIRKNSNGTVDRGAAQINSVHLEELARYGIGPNELMNECVSINVAAWILRKRVLAYGNTCKAIGSYHSKSADKSADYIVKIQASLRKWNILMDCTDATYPSLGGNSTSSNRR